MTGSLLIVGASCRAAAASAIRDGHEPWVIDLFADADTQRLAKTLQCVKSVYPQGLVALAEKVPPMPWMYTGGLENEPGIVTAISRRHQLVGIPCEPLLKVRNPFVFADVIRNAGGKFPENRARERFNESDAFHLKDQNLSAGSSNPARWIGKCFKSAGGIGIYDPPRGDYFQEFIEGEPVSAAFQNETCLGVSFQLSGADWLHSQRFHYCGNIRDDDSPHRAEFERLGQHLARMFKLKSYWGLDAIATASGLYILELNPRFTASRELYDLPVSGKAVYFAKETFTFPASGPWDESLKNCSDVWHRQDFADIPPPGCVIETGSPVMTLFEAADTPGACLLQLKAKAIELDRIFGVTP